MTEKNDDKTTKENKEGDPKKFTLDEFKSGGWREALSEEVGTDKSLADYKDLESVIKSHNHLQRSMGSRVPLPKDDGDEEAWNEFYSKIRPESVEGYNFSKPDDLPENYQYNENFEKSFKKKAHKYGLSKRQAKSLFNNIIKEHSEDIQNINNIDNERKQEDYKTLKKEWGDDYEKIVKLTHKAVKQIGNKNDIAWLQATGLSKEPRLLSIIGKMAMSLKPERLEKDSSTKSTLSKREAKSKIKKLLVSKAYINPDHVEHEETVEKVNELASLAY